MESSRTNWQTLGVVLFIASVGVLVLNHFSMTGTLLIEIIGLVVASFVCFGFAARRGAEAPENSSEPGEKETRSLVRVSRPSGRVTRIQGFDL